MSLYNNNEPFTSQIEMWSPTTSTNNIHLNITPVIFSTTPESYLDYSRFYHHEPVFYPTGCMICGQSHTKTEHPIKISTVITPTPTILELTKTTKPTKRKRIILQKSSQSISFRIRNIIYKIIKFIRIKLPFKNHNVYPVKRKESEKCYTFF